MIDNYWNCNMRTVRHFVLSLFIILCIFSCGGSSDPISRMEELATELENNSINYTIDDWKFAAEEYEQIVAEAESWPLSDEELNQLAKLKGKCYAYLVKGVTKMAEEEFDKQEERFNSALEGFLEAFE